MSFLADELHIFGWENIEGPLLATLSLGYPVLLWGEHGVGKTEGLWRILNSAVNWEPDKVVTWYTGDTSLRRMLGYLNPGRLNAGKVEWCPTPTSIWGKRGVILDEALNADREIQGELQELIRTKQIEGMQTDLEYLVAATNPPGTKYAVRHASIPFLDRFFCLEVPRLDEKIQQILESSDLTTHTPAIRDLFARLKSTPRNSISKPFPVVPLQTELSNYSLALSPRKAKALLQVYEQYVELNKLDRRISLNEHTLCGLISGSLPEITGLCRSQIDASTVRNRILEFSQQSLVRESSGRVTLRSLCKNPYPESPVWVQSLEAEAKTQDADTLRKYARRLMGKKGISRVEIGEHILNQEAVRKKFRKLPFSVSHIMEFLHE